MTLAIEYTRLNGAEHLGTILSLVLGEIGLRTKVRQTLIISMAAISALFLWEATCWVLYGLHWRDVYRASEFHLVGPSVGSQFWMEAGPYFLVLLIPLVILRALASRVAATA
jgi:hypothetical protein